MLILGKSFFLHAQDTPLITLRRRHQYLLLRNLKMYRVFLPYKISQIEHFQKPTLSSHTEAFHIASQGVTVIIDVALFACLTHYNMLGLLFALQKYVVLLGTSMRCLHRVCEPGPCPAPSLTLPLPAPADQYHQVGKNTTINSL